MGARCFDQCMNKGSVLNIDYHQVQACSSKQGASRRVSGLGCGGAPAMHAAGGRDCRDCGHCRSLWVKRLWEPPPRVESQDHPPKSVWEWPGTKTGVGAKSRCSWKMHSYGRGFGGRAAVPFGVVLCEAVSFVLFLNKPIHESQRGGRLTRFCRRRACLVLSAR